MKKYSGFTLLEILLYVVIGGVTLVIAVFSFAQLNRLSTSFRVNNELNQTANSIIEQIQNLANETDNIISPKPGANADDEIILRKDNIDTTIKQDSNNITVSYSNGDPSYNLNPAGILVVNTPANTLSFEKIDTKDNINRSSIPQSIKLKFTLRYNKPEFSSYEYEAEKLFETTINLSNQIQAFEPILNTYPTGANGVAYGLRKLSGFNTNPNQLSSAYNGSAIRVRRDRGLDQTEMDIGFTSKGELDQVALQNFVGYQNFLNYSEDITIAGGWSLNNITSISSGLSTSLMSDPSLYGERFNGYYNDNLDFFNTAVKHGDTNVTSQINNFTSNSDGYSWQWGGYFLPPTTGSYTFFTSSDDASHLWLGDNAITGYTANNALVNNGGVHGVLERSGTINLTAGQYYPIRIMFGEYGGGDIMTVAFSGPGIAKTANGTGYYFGGRYFWDRFVNNTVNTLAPDGTNTAEKMNLNTGNTQRVILKDTNITNASTYTDSYYVKANNGYNFVQIAPGTGFNTTSYQNYNLSNGTLGSSSGISVGQASIQSVGNGWYRISLTATANSTTSGRMVLAIVNSASSARLETVNVATNTDSIFVWGAMRHLGSTLKPYQQTLANANTGDGYVTTWYDQSGNRNNATQTSTSSQPKIVDGVNGIIRMNNKPVIKFDGTDDTLVSSSFNNATNSTAFFVASRGANNQSFMARSTNYTTLGTTDLFNIYYLNKSNTAATTGADTKNSLNIYTAIRTSAINSTLSIGAGSAGNFLNGNMAELIVYDGNKLSNRTPIENNLRDYYGTP
ncbi:MAG: Bathycoccus sp [Candidatus Parcubacteria bacterium]|jgi:type II secretory pathway pseudopilin PulG